MYLIPLYSGSSGNCTLIDAGQTKILSDAGLTGKAIKQALCEVDTDPASISAIVITHEHSDHIKGVGVMSRKYNIPVYANKLTWKGIGSKIGEIAEENKRIFETGREFSINDVDIMPFKIPHDTYDPVGFTFRHGGRCAAIATDIGYITQNVHDELLKCNIVLIEANHDRDMLIHGIYPRELQDRILGNKGHLSNDSCGEFLCDLYRESGLKRAILGHLSQENNTEKLAYETVSSILAKNGIGSDYMLKVAHRDTICGIFEV